jgi:hypothetical protein
MTEYEGLTFEERGSLVVVPARNTTASLWRDAWSTEHEQSGWIHPMSKLSTFFPTHIHRRLVVAREARAERVWILLGGGETGVGSGKRSGGEQQRKVSILTKISDDDLRNQFDANVWASFCMSLDLETVQAVKRAIAMVASLLIHHHFKLDDKNTTIILNAEETVFFQRFLRRRPFSNYHQPTWRYPPQDDREERKKNRKRKIPHGDGREELRQPKKEATADSNRSSSGHSRWSNLNSFSKMIQTLSDLTMYRSQAFEKHIQYPAIVRWIKSAGEETTRHMDARDFYLINTFFVHHFQNYLLSIRAVT